MSTARIPELDDLPQYPSWLAVVKTYARCHRLLSVRLAALDLSVAQHELLLAVGRDEGLSQQTLAGRLLTGKSNVTALLQRLESRGLVRREQDAQDARGRHVYLTDEGRDRLAASSRVQAEVVELMTAGLSPAQIATLGDIMRTVGARLADALGPDEGPGLPA
jgi:DNA-binding MarR family transcriptional regulator